MCNSKAEPVIFNLPQDVDKILPFVNTGYNEKYHIKNIGCSDPRSENILNLEFCDGLKLDVTKNILRFNSVEKLHAIAK